MSLEGPAVLLTSDFRPRREPGDLPVPPIPAPEAARLWLVASLALWALILLAVRHLLG